MRPCWLVFCVALAGSAQADEIVSICHGYSCVAEVPIVFSEARLQALGDSMNLAVNAADERKILAEVVGQLYAWAGEQSDVHRDRGGNYADGGQPGKMDCIDHSASTTRLLKLLESRGYLRWHWVLDIEERHIAWIFSTHLSAVIQEKDEEKDEEKDITQGGEVAGRFVIDSWFVDNGQPAVVLPLDEWKKGAGPDV